jgi:hypothetical protein
VGRNRHGGNLWVAARRRSLQFEMRSFACGIIPAALSPSTFKPAIFRRWRPLALGAAVLVIIELGAGVTLVLTDLLMRPPTAVLLNLKDGQREVGLKQSLSLTFSRPVLPSRVESSIRIDPTIDGALKSIGSDHRHFSWTPAGPWTDLTTYTVTALPFRDGSGMATAKHLWRFTTTIVPRVTSLTTENGTATGDGSELPIASTLKLAFNAAMAPATVKLLQRHSRRPDLVG